LYITAVAGILGLYISKEVEPILILIPFLTILVIFGYMSCDIHVGYLCKWLKNEYTPMLESYVSHYKILSLPPWHWDNSSALDEFYKSGAGKIRYLFLGLLFLLANIVGPTYVLCKETTSWPTSLIPSIIAIVVSEIVLAILYRKRKAMA